MKKRFEVINTPEPASEEETMKPLYEVLETARNENLEGLIIGIVRPDSLAIWTHYKHSCKIENLDELLLMIKTQILETEEERRDDNG